MVFRSNKFGFGSVLDICNVLNTSDKLNVPTDENRFFYSILAEDEEIHEDNSKEKCKKDETISYKRRSLNFKDVLAKYTSDRAKRGST